MRRIRWARHYDQRRAKECLGWQVCPRPPIRSIFFHWSETSTILPSILDVLAFFYNMLMLRFWISKLNQKLSVKSDTYWWMWPRRCEQRSGMDPGWRHNDGRGYSVWPIDVSARYWVHIIGRQYICLQTCLMGYTPITFYLHDRSLSAR